MHRDAEGIVYPDAPFVVDPERVAAFREVFGLTEGVPPTFVTAAEFQVIPLVIADPRVGVDFSRVVHGSQEYAYERPLREGETLTLRARLASIRSKGGSDFLTIETTLTDAEGTVVCTARSVMIERTTP